MKNLPSVLPSVTSSASLGWQIIVQPAARLAGGAFALPPIILPAPEHTEADPQTGNIIWTWTRRLPQLSAALSRNVQQQRTRSGTYAVIADTGATLVQITYQSGTNSQSQPQALATGVLSLAGVGSDAMRYSYTLTLTRCDVLYTRDGQRQQP